MNSVFTAVALIILGVFAILIYNRLVALRNQHKNAYAQIDVQLKRRYDLIPNLVETAKTYLKHERETLEAVIKARNQAMTAATQARGGSAEGIRSLMGAEAALGGALGRLMAVVEDYPDLKADQTMMQLSEELTSTENRIAFARQAFNDAVMVYNTARESFPANLMSGMFNFKEAVLWEVSDAREREAVKVSFS